MRTHRALRTAQLRGLNVWHYTDVKGLLGIVQSHTLWATSALLLNDSREVQFGLDYVNTLWKAERRFVLEETSRWMAAADGEFAKQHPKEPPMARTLDRAAGDYLDWVLRKVSDELELQTTFVACASLEGDSLSQWRAYGADSAYAIELDTNVELKILTSPNTPHLGVGIGLPGWEPVIYEAVAQRADALRRLCFTASMTTDDEGDWPAMYFACALTLVGGITRMKHIGFSDEREVRWAATHGTLAPAVNYRPGRLGVTPYVAITPPGDDPTAISARGESLYSLTTATPSRLPIKQVKIGPVKYPRAAEYGLRQLLDYHGYADVPVTQSDVPYR